MQNHYKKNLLFVTGTRADFGKLQPLAIEAIKEGFKVTFFITGMHMLDKYGLTKIEVSLNNDFETVEFLNQRDGDPQDVILSKTIIGFSDYVNELKPDMVIIHGDRVEAIACSIVCATNYILSIHIEGGEVSGTIDEIFRHCNTKLCNIHMVSSEDARKRVIQLGENKKNIYVIGSPELDIHRENSGVSISEVKKRYEITFDEYGICIFHSVTSELDKIDTQAEKFFKALCLSKKYFVVILPNNDPGSEVIKEKIQKLDKKYFKVLPSMRFNYFSELIKNCSLFIGNSSAGVRELPFLGICSINIGSRQTNRGLSSSIKQIDNFDELIIKEAILKNWNTRFEKDLAYGKGNAAKEFVNLLKKDELWEKNLQKKFKDSV